MGRNVGAGGGQRLNALLYGKKCARWADGRKEDSVGCWGSRAFLWGRKQLRYQPLRVAHNPGPGEFLPPGSQAYKVAPRLQDLVEFKARQLARYWMSTRAHMAGLSCKDMKIRSESSINTTKFLSGTALIKGLEPQAM